MKSTGKVRRNNQRSSSPGQRGAARDLKRLSGEIEKILPLVTEIRRTIHRNPEIALKEFDTAALVRKTLKGTGVNALKPFLETDVVGILKGKKPGKNVTLRADIDALPLQEKTGLPYASKRQGFMHACGHDGHTAMLIGAALILSRMRDEIQGSVRFVFQPGEEIVAAGKNLVEKGALRDPRPDAVFALHAWSGMPLGALAAKPGVMLAASDFFTIRIKGKGAHGSRPEDAIDPILTAARVIESLQAVVSRRFGALDAAVLSVCRMSGGTNANIIPDSAEIEGTTRYLKPQFKQKMLKEIKTIVKGVCDSMGASFELSYVSPYIPTINDEKMVALGKETALDLFGKKNWIDLDAPSMGAEDFSYFIKNHPGAMFRLGMGEKCALLHNPYFDFNDRALRNGILLLVSVTLRVLQA